MSATTNPELLIMPLARDGEKNTLPETTGATTGQFSQQYGFQQINATPLTAGGKAPDRKDINGAFNLLSGIGFFAQKGWTFHYDSTQDYYLGCVVIDPADGKRYECIADMAAGDNAVAPHEDENNTYWRRFTLGDGVPIATIFAYSSNGELPSGYLLCDGSAVSRTMFPDLFAAIGTTYGSGDGSTTFNLPDYNTAQRFAQGGTVAGVEKEAGLPNITGWLNFGYGVSSNDNRSAIRDASGAFTKRNPDYGKFAYGTIPASGESATNVVDFNASNSSAIYGNSTTVQPPALTTRYIIKAFDGQTADSALIDITQYAQELVGKANITGSNLVHRRDVITTSGTYTAPVTGLYKITVKGGGGGGQGGGSNTTTATGGHGGGEGGTTIGFEHMTVGDTASVIIGAGGSGGAKSTSSTTGSNGTEGGDSSVIVNSNTYVGGGGGSQSGGTGTIPGATGQQGSRIYNTATSGNIAAYHGVGGGNGGARNASTNGVLGGGGAGGQGNINGADAQNGGAGGNGYVWFEYYTPGT